MGKKSIQIAEDLYQKLEKRSKEKNLGSVDEYIESILNQVVERLGQESQTYSSDEEKKVKERLKSLGYLD